MRSAAVSAAGPLALLATLPAAAAPAAITFDQALGLAPEAPRPAAARRALADKRAFDAHISRITLNPQIAAIPGFRLEPEDAREPELIVEILQPWNLSGHAAARRRAVGLEEAASAALERAALLTQRLEIARAWIDRWAAQAVLTATGREEALMAELERLTERAAQAGAATRADVADVRALHGEARLLVLAAEGDAFARGVELGRALGRGGGAPIAAAGPLPDPPLPDAARTQALVAHVAELPEVRARALEAEVARARGVEEQRARGHVLQTGVVLQRDSPGGLVLSGLLRWTPPLFDRGRRERGVLAADAARLDGERREAAVRARADLALALHEVEHTAAVLAELRDRLVPASDEAAAARARIFAAGEGTVVEVLQSRRTAISASSRLARAQADHAWARIKLWLLLTALARGTP